MALNKTLREGQRIRIGDAVLTVRKARKGAARLVIDAPQEVSINGLPDEGAPDLSHRLRPGPAEPLAGLSLSCAHCLAPLGDPPHSSGFCGRCRKGLRLDNSDDTHR